MGKYGNVTQSAAAPSPAVKDKGGDCQNGEERHAHDHQLNGAMISGGGGKANFDDQTKLAAYLATWSVKCAVRVRSAIVKSTIHNLETTTTSTTSIKKSWGIKVFRG